jgi:hypothetical protein
MAAHATAGASGQLAMADIMAAPLGPGPTEQTTASAHLAELALACRIPTREACELLDLRKPWLGELVRRGFLHPVETPLGRLFDRDEVLRLAEARRIAQAGRPRRGRPRKESDQQQEVIIDTAALPA